MPGRTGKRAKAPSPCKDCGKDLRGGSFHRRKDGDWCPACYETRFLGKPAKAKYPEHDKLRPHADKTNFTMEFIKEHCEPKGVFLSDKDGRAVCVEDLLYEFIEVDRWKLEDEKRAMVDSLQKEA